jgi:hypothetical protein
VVGFLGMVASWHDIVLHLKGLCVRQTGPDVERAWYAIRKATEGLSEKMAPLDGHLETSGVPDSEAEALGVKAETDQQSTFQGLVCKATTRRWSRLKMNCSSIRVRLRAVPPRGVSGVAASLGALGSRQRPGARAREDAPLDPDPTPQRG